MLTRVALFAASLAASAVLAIGLALFGLAPASPTAGQAGPMNAAATDTAPVPVTEVDTTYVVSPAPSADPTPPPIVITRVVGGGGEDEHGDDD